MFTLVKNNAKDYLVKMHNLLFVPRKIGTSRKSRQKLNDKYVSSHRVFFDFLDLRYRLQSVNMQNDVQIILS